MIQLRILSGQTAGDTQVVRRFPFRIGRAPENDLRLEAAGGCVLTLEGEPMPYGKPGFENPHFLCWGLRK